MLRVLYSSLFLKHFKNIPPSVKKEFVAEEELFRENPFHDSLFTHTLRGKLAGHWAFSINPEYRIMFLFKDDNTVIFEDIGTHSIYK